MHAKLLLMVTLLFLVIKTMNSQEPYVKFHPGQEKWADTEGMHINAHGGGILLDNATYYWFGEHKIEGEQGNRAMVGVHVYSSSDLYNWTNEGIALKVEEDSTSLLQKGCTLERPKVIYNDRTGKYVMWFHHEIKDMGYYAALTGVAISDNVKGPYRYLNSFRTHPLHWPKDMGNEDITMAKEAFDDKNISRPILGKMGGYLYRDYPGGQMSRDMTLFKDDDGIAYHIASSEENQTLHISKLSDDYLSLTNEYVRVFPGGRNEAPAIFKKNGMYYMISSGLTGWKPNPARSAKANHIFGPWTSLGNPVRGTEEQIKTTFGGQSTFVLPILGKKESYIFMADQWTPDNPIHGRYVWLPIEFEERERPILKWYEQWDLNFFMNE